MQTQGVKQSISRERGHLDYGWLATLESRAGTGLTKYWKGLLNNPRQQIPFEIDNLIDCLMSHRAEAWLAHLRDVALFRCSHPTTKGYSYSINEVKEVTRMMNSANHNPLSAVLEREDGTVRVGHALRLLGQYNRGALRDLQDELDVVKSREQLTHLVGRVAQECAVAAAKTKFIIVPNDQDLQYLLRDVEQYGVRPIAEVLFVLSELWYPKGPEEEPRIRKLTTPTPNISNKGGIA